MAQCLFCKKDLVQTDGKKAKQFCNNTCRSNYWYGLNKKGKSKPKRKQQETKKEQSKIFSEMEAEFESLLKTKKDGKDT